jgi:hypothetical protein
MLLDEVSMGLELEDEDVFARYLGTEVDAGH